MAPINIMLDAVKIYSYFVQPPSKGIELAFPFLTIRAVLSTLSTCTCMLLFPLDRMAQMGYLYSLHREKTHIIIYIMYLHNLYWSSATKLSRD